MTLPQIISRNQKQSLLQNIQSDGNPTTIGTTAVVLYTCPAGKVALVTGLQVRFTGLGANTSLFVNARGRRLREDTTGTEASMVESAGQGIRLEATETITLTGDSGSDNGDGFFVLSIAELPA